MFNERAAAFRWDLYSGFITLVAALLCAVPLLGFVLAWHMQVDLPTFTRYVAVPGLVGLAACELYLVHRHPLLFNRFSTGLVGGLAATLVFDLLRLPAAWGFKGAPDYVPMLGQYLVGETIGIVPSLRAAVLGYSYHYLLIGALLGAAYSLVVGRGRWYWGTACGLAAGLAFVALPQVRLLTVATGFSPVVASLVWIVAFIAAGTTLGAVVQALGRTRSNALYVVFLREHPLEVPAEPVRLGR